MGKYAVAWQNVATTTALTTRAVVNTNAALEIGEIIELLVTGAGASGPQDYQHNVQGTGITLTTAGTSGSAVVAAPMTGGVAAASNLVAGITYSAEPTAYNGVASVTFGFNQRGGMRWAVPQGEGFRVVGATNQTNCGFGVRIISSTAGNVDGHIHFWEP